MHRSNTVLMPFFGENSLETLKHSALLSEKVALAFLTSIPRARRARFPLSQAYYDQEQVKRVSTELEWLYTQGLLDSPSTNLSATGGEMEDFDKSLPVWAIRTATSAFYFQPGKTPIDDSLNEITRGELIFKSTPELGIADIRNPLHNVPVVLSGRSLEAYRSEKLSSRNRNFVLDIVLLEVPQPSVETPWEAIFDWRNDEEAKVKFRRLKSWINKTSERKDLDSSYLQEEILTLLDDYRTYMKIQGAKFTSGTLRSIITGSAEALESLAKMKIKALAEMPFRISDAHLALDEAELKAPGRELAYIVEAQQRFR